MFNNSADSNGFTTAPACCRLGALDKYFDSRKTEQLDTEVMEEKGKEEKGKEAKTIEAKTIDAKPDKGAEDQLKKDKEREAREKKEKDDTEKRPREEETPKKAEEEKKQEEKKREEPGKESTNPAESKGGCLEIGATIGPSGVWTLSFQPGVKGKAAEVCIAGPARKKIPPSSFLVLIRDGKLVKKENDNGFAYNLSAPKELVMLMKNSKTKELGDPVTISELVTECQAMMVQAVETENKICFFLLPGLLY